jgi:hypothetical protein
MTVLIRTYRMAFQGHQIARWPLHHSWWQRLVAAIANRGLPAFGSSDYVQVTLRIQGPSTAFLDAEAEVRQAYHLGLLRRFDPHASHRFTVLLCQGEVPYQRPLEDRSKGQSEDYQRWLAGFYSWAPGTPIEDRNDYHC